MLRTHAVPAVATVHHEHASRDLTEGNLVAVTVRRNGLLMGYRESRVPVALNPSPPNPAITKLGRVLRDRAVVIHVLPESHLRRRSVEPP